MAIVPIVQTEPCATGLFAYRVYWRRMNTPSPLLALDPTLIIDPRVAPPEPFAALIFDCDGTLADTMPTHYVAWRAALNARQADMTEDHFYSMAGWPTDAMIRQLNAQFGYGLPVEETHDDKERRYVEMLHQVVEIKAIADIARAYKGKVPIAVASGATAPVLRQTLDAVGLTPLFDAIVSSDEVTHGKPAPDIFLLAAERLGVPPEQCIVYEDGEPGIVAGQRAGMRVVDIRVLFA